MLTPEYLSNVPDRMSEIYAKVEEDIIAYMAERIAAANYANASVLNQVERLEEMGMVRDEIWRRLALALDKSEAELQHIMLEAGIVSLESEDEVYRRAGLDPAPLRASESLQTVLETGYERTFGEFKNITATTANTATGQFERVLDQAYTEVASGIFSSQEAVKKAIERLSKQGVQSIVYPSGHTDSLDVAIRRAVRTGVNQACGDLQMKRAEEMECDLVQVTAHQGARPDHAVWQGKIFSISGKHKKYPKLVDATGYGTGPGLKGWGCRHDFSGYIEGTPPMYSAKELKEINDAKVTYNGKEIPLYEATQIQRKNERQIRRWKREAAALKAAGQPNSKALAKVRQWTEAQEDFLEQTGLKRRYDLEKDMIKTTLSKGLGSGKKGVITPEATPKFIEQIDVSDSKLVESKIREYESSIRDAKEEHIYTILPNGKVYHFVGEKNGVNPGKLGSALKGSIMTHNHPADSNNEYSFSNEDFDLMKECHLKRLRGVDELFDYELSTEYDEVDSEVASVFEIGEYDGRHEFVKIEAKKCGYGYRRVKKRE